jgi:hypothetical protein
MRHFLRKQLGPAPLSCGVLARASAGTLVLGAGSVQRLSPANRTAVAGAVYLTVIAAPAHARLLITPSAPEHTNILDHTYPGR